MYNDTKSLPEKMPEDLKSHIAKEEERGSKNVRIPLVQSAETKGTERGMRRGVVGVVED